MINSKIFIRPFSVISTSSITLVLIGFLSKLENPHVIMTLKDFLVSFLINLKVKLSHKSIK